MRFIKKLLLTAVVVATPLAADPVRGLFVALNLGMRYTTQEHEYTNTTGAVDKKNKSSVASAFGISAGVLNQVEKTKVVVGGEASFFMNQSTARYNLQAAGTPLDGVVSIANPYTFGVFGILGTMMTPKLMFYAKAGHAWMVTTLKYKDMAGESPNSTNYKKVMAGISGGAGANYLLTHKVMIGGEYLVHMPSATTPRDNSSDTNGQKRKFAYHPLVHAINLKLSLLF